MHICFIDESGTPPKPTKVNPRPYFTLGAVFIPVAQWPSIEFEFQQLKAHAHYRIRGELKWRFFGRDNNDPRNNVSHLTPALQEQFRHDLFKILAKRNSVKAVIAVTKVDAAYAQDYYKDEQDLYAYAYKAIIERFQYHLQDLGRAIGSPQYGVVVADHRGKDEDQRLRRYHQVLINAQSGHNFSSLNLLVENLFLTPSETSVGIQFADMIAGAVNRRYCSDDRTYSDSILPILRSKDGRVDGYGLLKIPTDKW